MSLFQWFVRKPAAKQGASGQSSGLAHVDPTVPFHHASGSSRSERAVTSNAANRKSERLERRELLYAVVRDGMTRAGVLSASYKFKVLSLDSRGRQYLIMMDLARKDTASPERLAEIEGLIAQNAKARHDILVTSVYWRINEHVTAGLSTPSAPAPLAPMQPTKPRFDPLHADEVAAFKKAIAAAAAPAPLSAPGEIIRSGRRNPTPEAQEELDLDRRASPLSGTQYGELN
ncbi:MAG: hypothetical protein CFE44_05880 [Burkholderiales bacterium PBB4]|nr:MAG: hypothetical protein CFE44_05880 [Burkholderiales bacterium PBB4]